MPGHKMVKVVVMREQEGWEAVGQGTLLPLRFDGCNNYGLGLASSNVIRKIQNHNIEVVFLAKFQ